MSIPAKGILILAIGRKQYGKLAAVLAASIKNQSSVPVSIIHDGNTLNDLSPRMRSLFDREILVPCDTSKSDAENAFRLKLDLYRLSPYERTLFLDADNIMLPGKKADTWFEQLSGVSFTCCNSGYYDFSSSTDYGTKYPYWCEPKEAKEHFNIADDAKLPQLNSSFVYFEKGKAAEVFRIAKTVWEDKFESSSYRHSKTDEFCFNIACALTKTYPHQFPFQPLYFMFANENFSEEYIADNYLALSVIKDEVEPRVIDLYNKYMEYYFKRFGFTKRYYYSQKTEKEPRKIFGFWHIAIMNHWKEIVQEQLMILVNDGLYNQCEEIYVNVAGSDGELEAILDPYPKIKISGRSNLAEHEFPALALMKAKAATDKFFGFYFHTKGASKKDEFKDHWRSLLNHYNLRCWQKPYSKVSQVYDVAGANYYDSLILEDTRIDPHFSGNFYWFDSEYVNRLPEVYSLRKNRYEAEMWICKGNPKVHNLITHPAFDKIKEWFPNRKIGVFWQINSDYHLFRMIAGSGLLEEAHHSVAITDKMYDLSGFTTVSAGSFDVLLKSYCMLNPDAFIVFPTQDGVVNWKRYFSLLEQGYESVSHGDSVLWTTASHINSLSSLEDLGKKKHRKFLLSGSTIVKDERVIGFWHIALMNHFLEITKEQLQLMIESGLYEKAEAIFVGCVGAAEELEKLEELFLEYRKIKILSHSEDITQYEFQTLKILREKSRTEQPFYGFYVHSKGVSWPGHEGGKHWRDYMNYYNITQWKDAVDKLNQGFDTCGVKYLTKEATGFPNHYSGNFFWFNSTYARALKAIDNLDKADRMQAEFWICSGNANAASLCQIFVDYNTKEPVVL